MKILIKNCKIIENDFYGSELFTLDFRVVKVNEIKSTLTYELGIKNDICTRLINLPSVE